MECAMVNPVIVISIFLPIPAMNTKHTRIRLIKDPVIFCKEVQPVHSFTLEEISVSLVYDLYSFHHLSHNDFNVLVIDSNTLCIAA